MQLDKYSRIFIHYYSQQAPILLVDFIRKNKDLKVIADLGCGDGSILYSLAKNKILDNFDKIYAVDLSRERIRRVKLINNKINAFIADVCNLSQISDSEIDIIISNQVIEHVSNEDEMIKEMKRILNKDGFVYLSTVFKKWYGWYFYKNRFNKWTIDPTHEREYTKDEQLLDRLKKFNFEIIENRKILHWFPLTDFFLKRVGFGQDIYEKNFILNNFRKIKVPIIGYYNWEIICRKK